MLIQLIFFLNPIFFSKMVFRTFLVCILQENVFKQSHTPSYGLWIMVLNHNPDFFGRLDQEFVGIMSSSGWRVCRYIVFVQITSLSVIMTPYRDVFLPSWERNSPKQGNMFLPFRYLDVWITGYGRNKLNEQQREDQI